MPAAIPWELRLDLSAPLLIWGTALRIWAISPPFSVPKNSMSESRVWLKPKPTVSSFSCTNNPIKKRTPLFILKTTHQTVVECVTCVGCVTSAPEESLLPYMCPGAMLLSFSVALSLGSLTLQSPCPLSTLNTSFGDISEPYVPGHLVPQPSPTHVGPYPRRQGASS